MKILLIEPRNCWRGLNIALAYLASALKKADIEVKVLDMANHRDWPVEKMEKLFIEEFEPDLIGIALFYIGYFPVKEMITRIKGYTKTPIIVGGPQMMIEGRKILEDMPDLDFALVGDGEDAMVELCRLLEGKIEPEEIDGLIFRRNGTVVENKRRETVREIDRYEFPDYKCFGVTKIRQYTIITSRGCPYSCSYCFRSSLKWRPRSPENIIAELELAIANYKIEEFVITDDAFNILPERVFAFCDLLEKRGIKLPWYCTGVRADRMTDELAKRMKEVGCYSINIGVETLQPEIYNTLNRGMEMDDVEKCLKIIKKNDLDCTGYFMIGLPGDTPEKTWDTYQKARKMGISRTSYAILLPFPGTSIYDRVHSDKNIKVLEDYRTISTIWTFNPEFSEMKTSYETPEYTAKQKIDMYNRLRTLEGDPRPRYCKSKFMFAINCVIFILKYDLLHFPVTFAKLSFNFISRLIKSGGKHVYKFDIHYDQQYMEELRTKMKSM